MSWVKIDDQFPYNRKIISAGIEGRSLYITALCYVSHQLTDGFIPEPVLPVLQALSGVTDVKQTASKLLEVCLWDACEGGYMIHDYLEYNPTKDEVLKTREARKEAGAAGGRRSSESKQAKRQANAEQNSSKIQPPTRTPSPIDDSKESSSSDLMTELQKCVLSTFGAKRFKNDTQKAVVSSWEEYPRPHIDQALKWAATNGMGLGQAIGAISKALPKWGNSKSSGVALVKTVQAQQATDEHLEALRRAYR